MLEQALLEIRLPSGIVDTNNIVPGAIRPNNCKLDATWNFMNALKQTVTLILPIASKNIGRKIYVKRVDKDQTNLCRVLTTVAGKLDGTDGVELNVQESVILIASFTQWHVFSLDFKL